MQLNSRVLNSGVINGPETTEPILIERIGSGALLTISQAVGLTGSGNLLSFRQRVTAYSIGSGALLEFSQTVTAVASGSLLNITQIVNEPNSIPYNPSNPSVPSSPIPHYIVRNGFYPILVIGSYVWPDITIHDRYTITGNESEGRSLTFTLLFRRYSAYGPIDFEQFDGAPVILDIYYLSGGADRLFTGRINKVDVDIMHGSITCTCDDARREKILATYVAQTNTIGLYDADVLGQATDTFDLLEKRLSTTPLSVDVDRFGILQLSHLLPNATPHIELGDANVYGYDNPKGAPQVEKLLRTRVINTVNITLDYQYQRRYQGNAHFRWSWDTDVCEFLTEGFSQARRDMIESAATNTGWVINNPGIAYTELPANGLYNCTGVGVPIPWSTVKTTMGSPIPIVDGSGNPVTGTDGKQLYRAGTTISEDSRNVLAAGAEWNMSYRWTQNVKETYTVQVTAPQSVARYGVVVQEDQTGIDDSSDNSEWENYKTYQSKPAYTDYTPNRYKLFTAFNILVNKAKTTIIKAHRDNRVTFSCPLISGLEMYHTVYLNTSRVQALGKVISFTHSIDIPNGDAYTSVTIALCRSSGSVSDTPAAFPAIPVHTPITPSWNINMGSIYGDEPTANFRGFVGNRWKTEDDYTYGFRGTNTYRTNVQEQFIVKAPDIGAQYRDLLQLVGGGVYNMSLPNNILNVSFL